MKGIVMDIRGKKAVVYCNNGQMIEMSNRNYQVGQSVSVNSRPYVKYIAAVACFLMFCITGIAGHHIYYTSESYIYLDINPSIRLDINCFERVIAVVPLNEDASALLTAHPVKSADTDECINIIVESCRENKYIDEKNTDVEIEVMTDNPKLKNKVSKACDNLKNSSLAVKVSDVGKEEGKRAIALKVSPKRLEALEVYAKTFGGDVNSAKKDLSGISTKDIYRRIENYNNGSAQSKTSEKSQKENPQETKTQEKPKQSQKSEKENTESSNQNNTDTEAEKKQQSNSDKAQKNFQTKKPSNDNSSSSGNTLDKGNSKNGKKSNGNSADKQKSDVSKEKASKDHTKKIK